MGKDLQGMEDLTWDYGILAQGYYKIHMTSSIQSKVRLLTHIVDGSKRIKDFFGRVKIHLVDSLVRKKMGYQVLTHAIFVLNGNHYWNLQQRIDILHDLSNCSGWFRNV